MKFVFDRFLSILIFLSFSVFLLVPKGGIIFLLLIILSLAGLIIDKNQHRSLNSFEIFFILGFVCYFLSILVNVLIFDGELRDLDIASRFLVVLPIFFYLRSLNLGDWPVVWGVIAGSLIFGINIFVSNFLGLNFLTFFKHAGIVSLYGGILGVASLLLINSQRPNPINYLLLLSGSMGLLTALIAGGRGVWIAGIITLFIAFILNPMKWKFRHKLYVLLSLFLAIIVAYSVPNNTVKIRYAQSFISLEKYLSGAEDAATTSVGARLEMWKGAYFIIKDNPIFGIGEDNFKEKKRELIEKKLISNSVSKYNHPHGEYLSSMVEQGVFGLIVLLIVFTSTFFFSVNLMRNYKRQKQFSMGAVAFSISSFYIFYSATNGVFDHQNTTLFFAGILAVIFGIGSQPEDLEN